MVKVSYTAGIRILLLFLFFTAGYNGNSAPIEAKELEKDRYDICLNSRAAADYIYANEAVDKREEKITYLTFDDGPSRNTLKILEILDKYNIKATFFVVGKNVKENPNILKEIIIRGHMIGIHCYNHDYTEIYSSVEAYMDDFYKTFNLIKNITGIEPYIFRFPGGSVNSYNGKIRKDIAREMERRGFIFYDWNSSCEDTVKGATSEKCINSVINSSIDTCNIMLCHDIKDVTVLNLERYIKELNKKGYNHFDTLEGVPPVRFLNNF